MGQYEPKAKELIMFQIRQLREEADNLEALLEEIKILNHLKPKAEAALKKMVMSR